MNTYNPQNPVGLSGLFNDPSDDLRRQIEESQRRTMAAAQTNNVFGGSLSPGKLNSLFGFNSI